MHLRCLLGAPAALPLAAVGLPLAGHTDVAHAKPYAGGPYAYIADYSSNSVDVVSLSSRLQVASITGNPGAWVEALSPDGKTLYVSEWNTDVIAEVNTATDTVTSTFAVAPALDTYSLSLSPDGRTMYVVGSSTNSVGVVDVATGTLTATILVGKSPLYAALSSDGRFLYVANYTANTVSVIDTASNAVTATISGFSEPNAPALSADGATLYVPNYGNNTVSVVATASDTITKTITSPTFNKPASVYLAPNGVYAYIGNYGSTSLAVLDLATGTVAATTIGTSGDNYYPNSAFSPDGGVFYASQYDNDLVDIVDPATGSDTAVTFGGTVNGPGSFLLAPEGALSNLSWSASSAIPGQSGVSYTWNATLAGTAPLGSVTLTVPPGTSAGSLSVASQSGLAAGTAILSGTTVTFTLAAPLPAVAGTPVSLTISGFTNSSTSGSYTSSVTTRDPATPPDDIDTGISSPMVLAAAASTVVLAASPSAPSAGQSEALTATVTSSMALAGTVSFYDGTTLLGSATLAATSGTAATATFTIANLGAGTHSFTARYAGSTQVAASVSAAVLATAAAAAAAAIPVPATGGSGHVGSRRPAAGAWRRRPHRHGVAAQASRGLRLDP